MTNTNFGEESPIVGKLTVISMRGCEAFTSKIDDYLKQMRPFEEVVNLLHDAFSGLSGLYLYPQGVCNPMPYLAAFYYFEKFRVLENQFAYDKCVEIIKENNLKVTKSDLQEWARIGVFEWAKKRQIDLRGGNVRKVGSSTLAEKNKSDYT